METDKLKQLEARRLSVKELDALKSILSGRTMPSDEIVVQEAIDRELKSDKNTN